MTVLALALMILCQIEGWIEYDVHAEYGKLPIAHLG